MTPYLNESEIDLGLDKKRMSNEDPRRQPASVNKILRGFYGPLESNVEIQLLADEVGMGKTFVALATAYTILDMVRNNPLGKQPSDLSRCFGAVLVVTPAGNHALAKKWEREVEAFRTRCSKNADSTDWFQPKVCDTLEDLVESLCRANDGRRDPTKTPCVIICQGNIFSRRLQDAGERLRFLTACLFRWWGNKLTMKKRRKILYGACNSPGFNNWEGKVLSLGNGKFKVNLWDFKKEKFPFKYNEIKKALDIFCQSQEGEDFFYDDSERQRGGNHPEPRGLHSFCKTYKGNSKAYFNGFKNRLLDLYRELMPILLRNKNRFFPLVIVDEAHHWRKPQRKDCQSFRQYIAPLSRRLLLLTATPFQLHKEELLTVLETGECMEPAISADRIKLLKKRREKLEKAMDDSEKSGRDFSREWGGLSDRFGSLNSHSTTFIGDFPTGDDPRTRELEEHWDYLRSKTKKLKEEALNAIPGRLRPFFTSAIKLHEANTHLQEVMSEIIIRHRRQTKHRRYWIGDEYPGSIAGNELRPDQSQLHLSPGLPVPPHGELAQYLLMKVVAEITRGRHRTSLGKDLTGCYTTLWKSKEGLRAVESAFQTNQNGLIDILKKITGHTTGENKCDQKHPKVETVVQEVLSRWDKGEKSLVFCARYPTAQTLHRLIAKGVEKRLKNAKKALLNPQGNKTEKKPTSKKAMQQFRRSLTSRGSSVVPLFLDRVLLGWLEQIKYPFPNLEDEDLENIAILCARATYKNHSLYLNFEKPDRVFLSRAIEHVLAIKLQKTMDFSTLPSEMIESTKEILNKIASEDWVRFRYGDPNLRKDRTNNSQENNLGSDQIARTSMAATYDLHPEPVPKIQKIILRSIRGKENSKQNRILETLVSGPNLFLPLGSALKLIEHNGLERSRQILELIFKVSHGKSMGNWRQRAMVLDAVIRAFLREDILLRMPKEIFQGGDETWSQTLFRGFHHIESKSTQLEPIAERIKEFLSEISEMGENELEAHLRYATKSTATSVSLVTGSTKVDRDAVFNGFNTPLLPDILVCTQVGQEGIDLHRHCRHVIHYDLGWNPAAIEQKTGRTDRIGSKAMRERNIQENNFNGNPLPENQLSGLDIAMPYLAGTYDERMFERLRARAQVFDILTGGDPTADQESDILWRHAKNPVDDNENSFVPLPTRMLDDLRVNLAVKTT